MVPFEVLAGFVAVDILIGGNHAAAVHFREDQLLFLLRDFRFDLKVVFEAVIACGQEQYLDVDKPFERLALYIAGGIFGEEFSLGALDAFAIDVDVADTGEDIGARWRLRGIATGNAQCDEVEEKRTGQGGLLEV